MFFALLYTCHYNKTILSYLNGKHEKKLIIHVRMKKKNLSFAVNVCHHSVSFMMSNGDTQDGFFYPILTLMTDFHNLR